jgi:hypothetical protein
VDTGATLKDLADADFTNRFGPVDVALVVLPKEVDVVAIIVSRFLKWVLEFPIYCENSCLILKGGILLPRTSLLQEQFSGPSAAMIVSRGRQILFVRWKKLLSNWEKSVGFI